MRMPVDEASGTSGSHQRRNRMRNYFHIKSFRLNSHSVNLYTRDLKPQ